MKSKWIEIRLAGPSKSGHTCIWQVANVRTQDKCGEIRYWYGFNAYVFYPSDGFRFDADCLEQVAEHLRKVNNERRASKRKVE